MNIGTVKHNTNSFLNEIAQISNSNNISFASVLQETQKEQTVRETISQGDKDLLNKFNAVYDSKEIYQDYASYDASDDLIIPKYYLLTDINKMVFFPTKNAPDEVKLAFAKGLESMDRESRSFVHHKIESNFTATMRNQEKI